MYAIFAKYTATTTGVTFSTPVSEALKNPANPFSKELGAEIMYSTEKPNSEGVGVKGNGTEGVSNAPYKEINIHGKINTELDEVI